MVFREFYDALYFINHKDINKKIIHVIPIGEEYKPEYISSYQNFDEFYIKHEQYLNNKSYNFWSFCSPPKGTFCYPAVLVLE